jgi:hypothetical protein
VACLLFFYAFRTRFFSFASGCADLTFVLQRGNMLNSLLSEKGVAEESLPLEPFVLSR